MDRQDQSRRMLGPSPQLSYRSSRTNLSSLTLAPISPSSPASRPNHGQQMATKSSSSPVRSEKPSLPSINSFGAPPVPPFITGNHPPRPTTLIPSFAVGRQLPPPIPNRPRQHFPPVSGSPLPLSFSEMSLSATTTSELTPYDISHAYTLESSFRSTMSSSSSTPGARPRRPSIVGDEIFASSDQLILTSSPDFRSPQSPSRIPALRPSQAYRSSSQVALPPSSTPLSRNRLGGRPPTPNGISGYRGNFSHPVAPSTALPPILQPTTPRRPSASTSAQASAVATLPRNTGRSSPGPTGERTLKPYSSFSQLSQFESSRSSSPSFGHPSPPARRPTPPPPSRPSSPMSRPPSPFSRPQSTLSNPGSRHLTVPGSSSNGPNRPIARRTHSQVDPDSPAQSRQHSPIMSASTTPDHLRRATLPGSRNVRQRSMSTIKPLPTIASPVMRPRSSSQHHSSSSSSGASSSGGSYASRSPFDCGYGYGSDMPLSLQRRSSGPPTMAVPPSPTGSVGDNLHSKKRSFGALELRVLNATWDAGHYYPPSAMVEGIIRATDLSRPQIRGWFANRRQRATEEEKEAIKIYARVHAIPGANF
ncbi:hypothetical protein T439DRAFT_47081 [Meredithblackwellia eburnea MCA 4105]